MFSSLRSMFETEYRVLHVVEPDIDTYAVQYKTRWWPIWSYVIRRWHGRSTVTRRFETPGQALAYIESMRNAKREVVYPKSSLNDVEWPRKPMKITPLRRAARDAQLISELEKELAAARAQMISGFYDNDDNITTFSQGAPTHELQSVVTAEEVTGYMDMIQTKNKLASDLAEQVRELKATLSYERTALEGERVKNEQLKVAARSMVL